MGNKKIKRLRFFKQVSVILIPTKEEFHDAGITENLWHSRGDCQQYRIESRNEVDRLIAEREASGEKIDFVSALRMLYQPDEAFDETVNVMLIPTWKEVEETEPKPKLVEAATRAQLTLFKSKVTHDHDCFDIRHSCSIQ